MKRTLSPKVVLCACALLILLAVAGSVARFHHAFLVLSHHFHGRAGFCTIAESFEGEAISRLHLRLVAEVRAASRVVRSDDKYSLWSTPYGEFWMPTASGDALVYDLAEQQRNIYGTRVRRGDVVLDAGANVGVFTRKALWAGASRVIAIEPGPENVECLKRNFGAEIAAGRVIVYPKGIWDKDETLKFSVSPSNSAVDSFVAAIPNAQFIEVPVTTVDNLVAELRLPRVDFIKMDIEGAETKAIAGARGTISRFHPRMALTIYHRAADPVNVPKLVAGAWTGYTVSKTCLCAEDRVQPEVGFFY